MLYPGVELISEPLGRDVRRSDGSDWLTCLENLAILLR